MNVSQSLLMALLFSYSIIMMSSCAYHEQKASVAREREYLQTRLNENEIEKKELIQKNQDNKETKSKIENEIANLQDEKIRNQEKLAKLQLDQELENKLQKGACGEKCQEVKKIEKLIKELEQSIVKKKSALSVM